MARKQVTGAELQDPARLEQVFGELYDEEAAAEKAGTATFLDRARNEMARLVKWLSQPGSKTDVIAPRRK